MIDYQKLKLAHELVSKIHLGSLNHRHSKHDGDEFYFLFPADDDIKSFMFSDLDELIVKLQELTKPKPKFKVGDVVWYLDPDKNVTSEKCTGVVGDKIFFDKSWYAKEDMCYPSRESLIKSQIAYWQSLCEKELAECEHKYNFNSGFACVICGFNPVKDGGAES